MKNHLSLLAGICLLLSACFSFGESLLLDAPAPLRTKAIKTAKRQRYVTLNPNVASKLLTPGSQFDLPLFDGEQFTLQVNRANVQSNSSFTIQCSVPGKSANYMLLACENGAFTASFHTGAGRLFRIKNAGGALHTLSEADPSIVPKCGVNGKTPATPVYKTAITPSTPITASSTSWQSAGIAPRMVANVTPAKLVLDVMVVYTAAARDGAGSDDAIKSEIKLAMAEGQFAFDNSQINVQLRLVYTGLVNYTETGNFQIDLPRLGNPTDGFMDDAIVLRDKYKADILSLWVEAWDGQTAGLAYKLIPNASLYTYNVIYRPTATGTYIPAHEIGHNFGCDHEPERSTPPLLYPYAHGHIFQTPGGAQKTTVMTSSADSRRIPYFSSPNVFYDDGSGAVPTGDSTTYNNVLVMNNTVAKLTSFRVPPSLGEALDATTISWTTGGDVPWFWQPGFSHDGSDAAQSGGITDNQTTYLRGTVSGPAKLSYWRYVSSESGGDFLTFYLDGNGQWSDSGGGSWVQETQFVPSGTHSIQWTYSKNGSVSEGSDAAWIDQVVVKPLKLPTVVISSPAANARLFSPNTNVTGTARDDVQVDHVEYQLHNSSGTTSWLNASGTTNWSVSISLVAGTNTIAVRSIGFGGQTSLAVSRSFFYVVTNQLTVATNGLGKISPNLNGKFLEIGRRYTITATPSNNWVFSNWSGTISSNAAVLNFLMRPNMMLQGNFVTNPFIPVKGIYNGLFREADAVRQSSAGFITLTLATTGSYAGKMYLDGASYVLSGRFDLNGGSQISFSRLHTNSVSVAMNLNLIAPDDTISGTVSSGSWTSAFTLDRAVFDLVKNKATNFVGKYTLAISGYPDAALAPAGDSYATVSVDKAGMIRASGSMADGTTFSQSVSVSKNGSWPLFVPLYVSKGMLFSDVSFSNSPASTLGGDATWIKPSMRTTYYSNGFVLNTFLTGSSFAAPSNGVRVLNFTNGTLALTGANLAQGFTNTVVLNSNNTVAVTGPNAVSLLLNKTTGSLAGSHFTDPVTRRSVTIKGVILQNQNEARGYFLGTNHSGSVLLRGD